MLKTQKTTIELTYDEARHINDMIKMYQDHSKINCLLCFAAILHFQEGLKEAAKDYRYTIKRIDIDSLG